MKFTSFAFLCCFIFVGCFVTVVVSDPLTNVHRPALSNFFVAKDAISISGISSGAAMATQFHVAYSSSVMGVGIVTGPPYYCAQANVMIALSSCMKNPELIVPAALIGAANYAFTAGSIDNPAYLKTSNVFLFHGTNDNELVLGVAQKVRDFYTYFVPDPQIKTNLTIPAAHSFVTKNYGNSCGFFGEPYMNNCGYDTAGEMLNWIYKASGPLNPPVTANLSNLIAIDQSASIPFPWTAAQISMSKTAYAYVPLACREIHNACKLHIALHGCLQNVDAIGSQFILHSGYNGWAESNNIIIIYPQTIASPTLPYNPKGCWDWWGYTGLDYATQYGPQMMTIHSMIRSFTLV